MCLMKTMRHGCIHCPQQWMLARNNLAQVYLQRELFHLLHKHWINPSSFVAPHRRGSTLSPLMRPTTSTGNCGTSLKRTVAAAAWLNYNLLKLQEGYQAAIFIHTSVRILTQRSSRTTLVICPMGRLMKAMLYSRMWTKCTQMEGMLQFRSVAYVHIRSIDSLVPLLTE